MARPAGVSAVHSVYRIATGSRYDELDLTGAGAEATGGRWNHNVWMQWIQQRRSLEWVLAHMNEARFDEEFTSPFKVLPSAALTEGA